jgi:hypothetical protein
MEWWERRILVSFARVRFAPAGHIIVGGVGYSCRALDVRVPALIPMRKTP